MSQQLYFLHRTRKCPCLCSQVFFSTKKSPEKGFNKSKKFKKIVFGVLNLYSAMSEEGIIFTACGICVCFTDYFKRIYICFKFVS